MELLDRALIEKGQLAPLSGEIPHGVSTVVTREVWCSYCVDGNLSAGTADSSLRAFRRGDDRPDRPAFYRDLEGNGVDRL
jgi:hypothetical protein